MIHTYRRGGGCDQPRRPTLRLASLLLVALPLLWACDPGVEPVLVGAVLISDVDTDLTVGNSVQLTATVQSTTGSVMPGHPVKWTSSAESVAKVSAGGLVTPLSAGTVKITATSESSSAWRDFSVSAGPCTGATAGPIATGQTRSGELDRTDCVLDNYRRGEGWSFQLTATTGVQIVMSSAAFYPDVLLTDRQLNPILWATWHPDGVQLLGELPAGQYIIWATSYDESATGAYQLSATEVEFCGRASATVALGTASTASGTLGASDCLFLHAVRADGFLLNVPTGTGLRIDLNSTAFDALLVVTDLEMNVLWWDDDSGTGTDSRIERRFAPGEYLVWSTAWDGGSTGAYGITTTEVEIVLCPTIGELELGTAASGTLSGEDCRDDRGYWDPWRLTVASETTIQIDLRSSQFDALLMVENEYGEMLAADDDGGTGTDSRLQYTFPAGEYRVLASSWNYGATGAYQLMAQAVAGGSAASLREEIPATAPLPWMKGGGKAGRRD